MTKRYIARVEIIIDVETGEIAEDAVWHTLTNAVACREITDWRYVEGACLYEHDGSGFERCKQED